MTDPELEQLASLWRQPDSADRIVFDAIARKARWRAQWQARADILQFAILIVLMAGTLFFRPAWTTAALGLPVAAVVGWLSWRRRAVRLMWSTLDTGDRAAFVDGALRIARADLRNVMLSLYLFPTILIALLFALSSRHGGRLDHPLLYLSEWAASRRGRAGLAFFALMAALLLRFRGRTRAEIGRLEALKRAYDEEEALDGPG